MTGTGFLDVKQFQMMMETGIAANSSIMINYNIPYFNPLYGEAVWKCYMNSMDNCFAFFGYKETTATPIPPSVGPMVESHAGFIIDEGKLYASVADGTEQQKVEIIGIDTTRVENFKINYNRFYIEALPQVESELGIPGVLTTFPLIKRKFVEVTQLSNYPPINQVHYIVHYISNQTNNLNKRIYFNRFIYKEVYAD